MVKVFLVDDHEVVRRGLVDLLSADDDLEVVGEAVQSRRRWRGYQPCDPTSLSWTCDFRTATASNCAEICCRGCPICVA